MFMSTIFNVEDEENKQDSDEEEEEEEEEDNEEGDDEKTTADREDLYKDLKVDYDDSAPFSEMHTGNIEGHKGIAEMRIVEISFFRIFTLSKIIYSFKFVFQWSSFHQLHPVILQKVKYFQKCMLFVKKCQNMQKYT